MTTKPATAEPRTSYIERTLRLLELVSTLPVQGRTATVIARAGDVPLSTAARLLSNLCAWGYLRADHQGWYVPGPRLVAMSVMVRSTLPALDQLEAAARRLTAEIGESVTVGQLVGDNLYIVARAESEHAVRAVNRLGEPISPSTSALGKAVMALVPPWRRLQLLDAAGETDPQAALAAVGPELELAAVQGYANDEEQFAPGLRCRAVAVLDADQVPYGGLSVGGPAARFTASIADSVVPLLQDAAEQLSLANPAHGPDRHQAS
ncbi:transcriptional regulator, IclR family [Microlunatus sagamiharensis]|uniref:Transcriptional regulator, IclR family n=1 Tax=Microlunatus sagamiharensis TaxID=546874 RepID=A0A1H2MLR2_9ACTN|nr:IclR family transcriptional regulator [Microlunatus sagamiharensis]SDU93918.1 transcriptional regulator, IclR family [Microlunatus sagamiharensis]